MPRIRLQPVYDWLKRVITQPQEELTRWQATVRIAYDLGRYGAVQLKRDRAPQMAAALSFRTLFGLLPVLVVGAVMIRAIRGSDEFVAMIQRVIEGLGLFAIGPVDDTLGDFLLGMVSQAADYNFAAIGWVGVAVLVYSAISLMGTIENGFNIIYRAPEGRPWHKRVQVYWFVLTVGPAAVALTLYLNSRVEGWITSIDAWHWVLEGAAMIWTFISTLLILLVVYKLVPNTNIAGRPALIGAIVATILLTLGKRVLGVYLTNAVSLSQLYGSLGLIPLFMFWVYLMWLVILFGLEVSATLQMLHGRTLDKIEQRRTHTGLIDPASVVTVMEVIAERFGESKPTTAFQIGETTMIPQETLQKMLGRLADEGLVHRLENAVEDTFSLARPPESIPAQMLIDIGFSLVDDASCGRKSPLLDRLREAQRSMAAQSTLASLLSGDITSGHAPSGAGSQVPSM